VETPKQANERAIYAANATIYALNAKKKQYWLLRLTNKASCKI
jgi:hypothetical protein